MSSHFLRWVANGGFLTMVAAAERAKQPLMKWDGTKPRILGVRPSTGIADALDFALTRAETRASEFAGAQTGVSITNASTKFKQLWEQGFLLRREAAAESGTIFDAVWFSRFNEAERRPVGRRL